MLMPFASATLSFAQAQSLPFRWGVQILVEGLTTDRRLWHLSGTAGDKIEKYSSLHPLAGDGMTDVLGSDARYQKALGSILAACQAITRHSILTIGFWNA